MKYYIFLLFGLILTSAKAQKKEVLLSTMTTEVCDCIEKVDVEKLDKNLVQMITNCVQISFSINIDDVMDVYGEEALTSYKVGEEIGIEVSDRLIKDCEYYANYIGANPKFINLLNGNYTEEQWAMIYQISNWACICSNQEVENNPDYILQKTLNNCLQQAINEYDKELINLFGEEYLNNQYVTYNLSIEAGNKLITTCDLFIENIAGAEAEAKGTGATGQIKDFNTKGDFIVITLVDKKGGAQDFVVNYGFESASDFVMNLKDLKNNQTEVTLYFYEDELFFKKENVKRVVNVIADVKF